MQLLGGERVHVATALDAYHGLSESGFELAQSTCHELDHGHFAPPCRILTMARRSDSFGEVPALRSDACPEGYGDLEAWGQCPEHALN